MKQNAIDHVSPAPIEKLQAENEELRRQLDALQLAVMGMMDEGG
ncbi:hypothetical protein [Paenibacillus melissococcoides]|nr:hypothetical protein [Paenibacillus melissococcoides]